MGLREIDDTPEVELLYGFAPAHWGRGLALEAARVVLAHGFDALGLERIAGRTDTPNRASVRVLERLGMGFEGERLVGDLPTLHFAPHARGVPRGLAPADSGESGPRRARDPDLVFAPWNRSGC